MEKGMYKGHNTFCDTIELIFRQPPRFSGIPKQDYSLVL